jgi:hypothetical protein
MSNASKYIRLPIESYQEVRHAINELLRAYEIVQEQPRQEAPKLVKKSSVKPLLTGKPIVYQCGCIIEGGLIKRAKGCKLGKVEHI